eukprot:2821350-Rhodomonas_salina.1
MRELVKQSPICADVDGSSLNREGAAAEMSVKLALLCACCRIFTVTCGISGSGTAEPAFLFSPLTHAVGLLAHLPFRSTSRLAGGHKSGPCHLLAVHNPDTQHRVLALKSIAPLSNLNVDVVTIDLQPNNASLAQLNRRILDPNFPATACTRLDSKSGQCEVVLNSTWTKEKAELLGDGDRIVGHRSAVLSPTSDWPTYKSLLVNQVSRDLGANGFPVKSQGGVILFNLSNTEVADTKLTADGNCRVSLHARLQLSTFRGSDNGEPFLLLGCDLISKLQATQTAAFMLDQGTMHEGEQVRTVGEVSSAGKRITGKLCPAIIQDTISEPRQCLGGLSLLDYTRLTTDEAIRSMLEDADGSTKTVGVRLHNRKIVDVPPQILERVYSLQDLAGDLPIFSWIKRDPPAYFESIGKVCGKVLDSVTWPQFERYLFNPEAHLVFLEPPNTVRGPFKKGLRVQLVHIVPADDVASQITNIKEVRARFKQASDLQETQRKRPQPTWEWLTPTQIVVPETEKSNMSNFFQLQFQKLDLSPGTVILAVFPRRYGLPQMGWYLALKHAAAQLNLASQCMHAETLQSDWPIRETIHSINAKVGGQLDICENLAARGTYFVAFDGAQRPYAHARAMPGTDIARAWCQSVWKEA